MRLYEIMSPKGTNRYKLIISVPWTTPKRKNFFANTQPIFWNKDDTDSESVDGLTRLEQLKSLKESSFVFRKNEQSESVWNMIADLHVELIFLYNKISVRMLEYQDMPKTLSGMFLDIFLFRLNGKCLSTIHGLQIICHLSQRCW
jgi:hypothetical protein